MSNVSEAVRKLTISYKVEGLEETKRGVAAVNSAIGSTADVTEVASKATDRYTKYLADYNRVIEQQTLLRRIDQQHLQQITVANDNISESLALQTVEVANLTNHLKTAAVALYAISPAFRALVNPAITEGVRVTTTAMMAMAPAAASAAGAALRGFAPLASVFLRLAGPILLTKDAIDLVSKAWELGGQKLEEFRSIAEKAAASDLSTDFFQRINIAATDAKLPIDEMTTSLKNLAQFSSEKLGGSDLHNRLDQLTKAGNFQGNNGVSQIAQANTTAERFRAISSLIDQAMAKGERLAALDLTSKFLSPSAQAALTADDEYLKNMLASADKIAATKLVSDADIGDALDLQRRYDAAVKILETRWHPIQDLLTAGGIKLQQVWVDIVETIAKGVDWVFKLAGAVASALEPYVKYLQVAANLVGRGLTAASSVNPIGPAAALGGVVGRSLTSLTTDVKVTDDYANAVNRLADGLKNTNKVQQAVAQVNAVQNAVWRDTSKAIGSATAEVGKHNDYVDRAINTLSRHIEQQKADALAIGLGAGALARFRAEAAQTAAVLANGGKQTEKQAADFAKLKEEAAKAADDLARARVATQIDWNQKTIGLSSDEVAIAQQLHEIYGNDIPRALQSTEAATLRTQNAMKGLSDAASQFGNNLIQALTSGKTGVDALLPEVSGLGSQLTQIGSKNLIGGIEGMLKGLGTSGFDPVSLGIGAAGIGVSLISSLIANDDKQKKEQQEAIENWKTMHGDVQAFNTASPAGSSEKAEQQKSSQSADVNDEKEIRYDRDQRLSAA